MRRSSGLPGPARRFGRDRILVATALFSATVAIAASSLATSAQVRLAAEVDTHWRGLYDILVRPTNSHLGLERTGGLVEPNFLGFTGTGGIDRGQLEAIRAIPGVEVAAPVAYIGLLTTDPAAPSAYTSVLPDQASLYRLRITITTSDGLASKVVVHASFRALLGPGASPARPIVVTDVPGQDVAVLTSPDGRPIVSMSTNAYLPPLSSPVLAVDPTAERALLGDAGAFLDRLIEASRAGPSTAATFDLAQVPFGYDAAARIGILREGTPEMRRRPVYPMIVSTRIYAPLQATLSVDQLGSPLAAVPNEGDPLALIDRVAELAGPGTTPIGTTRVDLGPRLRPLRTNDFSIPWPRSALDSGGTLSQQATDFNPEIAGRPAYETEAAPRDDGTPAFRIEPVGLVGAGGNPLEPGTSAEAGAEQAYRSWTTARAPDTEGFVPQAPYDKPFVLAPVGEFDLAALTLPADPLTYAPLGAYDPPDTTLVADASGAPLSPRPMTPTLNPAGLLEVPPLAIADLSAADGLRGAAPIDAVRVRVAGLTDFGPQAIASVERVASAIAAMGLDVDIVAGSSPQPVDVYVPAYDTSSDPPRDLGWVEQHWTTLGAASRVVEGMSGTNQWLLLLALLGVAVVIIGVQSVEATARVREVAILSAFGWGRGSIARWFVAESLVASALVVIAGGAAWAVLGRDSAGLAVTVLTAVFFPVATLTTALLLTRHERVEHAARPVAGRWPVRSVAGYSVRVVLERPWRSVAIVAGLAIAAGAIAPAAALMVALGARVGPTLLASALTAQLQGFQLALLALSAAGGIGFVLLGLRRDLADRRMEFLVLAASGWTPATVARALRWQRAVLFVPAAAIAFVLALGDAGPVTGGLASPLPVALLAAAIGLSAIAWGGAAARTGGR